MIGVLRKAESLKQTNYMGKLLKNSRPFPAFSINCHRLPRTFQSLDLFFHLSLSKALLCQKSKVQWLIATWMGNFATFIIFPFFGVSLTVFTLAQEAFHHCPLPQANTAYTQYYFYNCQQSLAGKKKFPASNFQPRIKFRWQFVRDFWLFPKESKDWPSRRSWLGRRARRERHFSEFDNC